MYSLIRGLIPDSDTKQGQLAKNFIAGAIGGTIGKKLNPLILKIFII